MAQWLEHKTLKNLGLIPLAAVLKLRQFLFRIASIQSHCLNSVGCMNEYVVTDWWICERIVSAVWLNASQRN